jgi:ABC-type transport system involved in multi-copper enzyme maturation permease subunit
MSAVPASSAPTRERPARQGVTLARVIRSEWTKLWSLRSTRWSLLLAFIAQAGLGPLIALITMSRWSHLTSFERLTINPIDRSLGGWHLAQLAIAVLGVMTITGEYSTGMIRSSLMAAPKRLPVLWAKLIVFCSVTLVLMLVAAVIGFFGSQALFAEHHVNASLSTPHALRALIGSVLVTTVTGALCVGLGTVVRRTAGGISLFVAVFFVLPGLVDILPSDTSNAINPYLPSSTVSGLAQALPDGHTFSPWGGFALFCGYTVLMLAIAARALLQRDA